MERTLSRHGKESAVTQVTREFPSLETKFERPVAEERTGIGYTGGQNTSKDKRPPTKNLQEETEKRIWTPTPTSKPTPTPTSKPTPRPTLKPTPTPTSHETLSQHLDHELRSRNLPRTHRLYCPHRPLKLVHVPVKSRFVRQKCFT